MLNPIELKSVDLDQYGAKFDTFNSSAFRLELLDAYAVDEEKELLSDFIAGKPRPAKTMDDWVTILASAKNRGAGFQRVRYLREPISEYVKFEIAWGYNESLAAGESILVLPDGSLPQLVSDVPILKDFWLFDDKDCYLIEYDQQGRFLGVKEVPGQFVKSYVAFKYKILSMSKNITETIYWELAK